MGFERTFVRDPSTGRVTTQVDARNGITQFGYDSRGNLIKTILPELNETNSQYQTIGGVECRAFTRDGKGQTTIYGYDGNGNLERITDPATNFVVMTHDSAGRVKTSNNKRGFVTQFGYNGAGNLTSITDAKNKVATFDYDEVGNQKWVRDRRDNLTSYDYDELRRLKKVTFPPDASNNVETVDYTYDHNGNVTEVKDALGRKTINTYDPFGRLLEVKNPLNHTITNVYDDAGRLKETTDARGYKTSFLYDDNDRLLSVTDAKSGVRATEYDEEGNSKASTDADNNRTQVVYDLNDRVTDIVAPDGGTLHFDFDDNGNRIAVINQLGHRTDFVYDKLNRLIETSRSLNGEIYKMAYGYDENGNRTSVTDPAGRTTSYVYDELDRLIDTIDPMLGVTHRDYDVNGNLITLTNARGKSWTFAYDARNRLISETDPLGYGTSYRYDVVGNLASKTDAKNQVTNYTYDELNRLKRVDYADGEWVEIDYDESGNRTAIRGQSPGGPRIDIDQVFDELNRVKEITNHALLRRLNYQYTSAGNRSRMEVKNLANGQLEQWNDYEWLHERLHQIVPWIGQQHTVEYSYNKDGSRKTVKLPNNLTCTYTYDDLGRLTQMSYTDANSNVISFFRYTYDKAGNRLTMADTEGLTEYSYDDLDRLIQANYPDSTFEMLTYDAVGNRLSLEDKSGITDNSYDAANRLLTAGSIVYTWDANGSRTIKVNTPNATTLMWNARNLLKKNTVNGTETSMYAYLPYVDLRSYSADYNTQPKHFLSDGSDSIQELDTEFNFVSQYIVGPNVDERIAQVSPEGTAVYIGDALGNVRALSGADGLLINSYSYTAFGQTRHKLETRNNPYRFSGRYFDGATGLYYFRARYYDPITARFISIDPINKPINHYIYAENNPLTYVDPKGLSAGEPASLQRWFYGSFPGQERNDTTNFIWAKAQFARSYRSRCCSFESNPQYWCQKDVLRTLRLLLRVSQNYVQYYETDRTVNSRPRWRFGPVGVFKRNVPTLHHGAVSYVGTHSRVARKRGRVGICYSLLHELRHYSDHNYSGKTSREIVNQREIRAGKAQSQWLEGMISKAEHRCAKVDPCPEDSLWGDKGCAIHLDALKKQGAEVKKYGSGKFLMYGIFVNY